MPSDFSEPLPHTKNENWPLSERAKMRWASTLSAVFENGRSPTFTGVRAFWPSRSLYRRQKTPFSTPTNKRTDPTLPRRDETITTRKISGEIFAKIAGTHGLAFSPAERKRALRVSRDRWRRGVGYISEASALGATPTLSITLNWEKLPRPDDGELDQDSVGRMTSHFVRRLSEWFRRRGVRRSFAWAAATGTRYGAHCHVVAHVPADHQQAFFAWLARTTGDPTDLARSNQSAAISDSDGWLVTFVHPAGVADAVCYLCIQSLKHRPSAFDPKKCFGISLSKK